MYEYDSIGDFLKSFFKSRLLVLSLIIILMGGVLLGFALGAMAFTAQGRELGNKLGEAALSNAKKVISRAKESAEQSTGTAWDDRHPG